MRRSRQLSSTLLLGLIYPFAGFLYGIRNFRKPSAKYLFIIFSAFYGSIIIFQSGGADISHYSSLLEKSYDWGSISPLEFYDRLGNHDKLDFFNPLITYLVSRFTGNPSYYFTIIGLIFGFFYANNIWDVIKNSDREFNQYGGLLVIVFALLCSFDTMGTVRMHTGFQVYFYGIFSFLVSGKKSRLLWVPLSILFHFSMFYLVAVTLIFYFVKEVNTKILLWFFLIAHLINQLDLEFVHNVFSFMPEDVETRLASYADEDKVKQLGGAGKFYLGRANLWARIDSIIIRVFILLQTIILFLPINRELTRKPELQGLLHFSLILYGFSLIVANLPSGYRFMIISQMFFMAYYVLLFNNHWAEISTSMKTLLKIASPFLIVVILKLIRNILQFVGIDFFIGNFVTSFVAEANVSVLELLKNIF